MYVGTGLQNTTYCLRTKQVSIYIFYTVWFLKSTAFHWHNANSTADLLPNSVNHSSVFPASACHLHKQHLEQTQSSCFWTLVMLSWQCMILNHGTVWDVLLNEITREVESGEKYYRYRGIQWLIITIKTTIYIYRYIYTAAYYTFLNNLFYIHIVKYSSAPKPAS